jgi:hypothetical protein
VRRACLVLPLFSLGCVDLGKCYMPTYWKPCPGETAQLGSSGSPPTIVELALPTCTSINAPTLQGTLHVTDPDGDAQVLKATFTAGSRLNESEAQLSDLNRSGSEWSGGVAIVVTSTGGSTPMESTDEVRMKVTDVQGGQSVPFCDTLSLVR